MQKLEPREIQARAVRGISWSTLSSVATLPLSIVVSVVLAHRLGTTGFARFALLAFLVPLATQVLDGGFWLALFAPRNQLVEFVLREDKYRRRMIDGVDPAYWIAPALASGESFLEPIQGGARKKLNRLKPWSPSWSYGLVARCDAAMRPQARPCVSG